MTATTATSHDIHPTISADVVVVGSINLDTTFRVARFPAEGETALAHSVSVALGGKGANQAVAAARGGARVVLIAAVGDDSEGTGALRHLGDHGVDTSLCLSRSGARTGMAHILVNADGANQITVASNANALLDPDDVASAIARVRGASVVMTQQEIAPSVVRATLACAVATGIRSVLNASPALARSAQLPAPDLLVVNRHEAEQLANEAGADAEALARALVAQQLAASAIVTDGGRGAAVHDGRSSWFQVAPPAEVVDTTGAGDAFTGALAAALARGDDLEQALAHAVAAGTRAVTQRGAQHTNQPDDEG